MSYEQIQAFGERIRSDEVLRTEIGQLAQDTAGIVAAAKREGYDFTEAELNVYLKAAGSASEMELDEEDLEQVVGGGGYTSSCSCACGGNIPM